MGGDKKIALTDVRHPALAASRLTFFLAARLGDDLQPKKVE